MLLNSREFQFLKNSRNVYGTSSAKRECRDENVFLKVDRACLSELITLLISNKKEFIHFVKSRSSYIVLLKLGNLHQNANMLCMLCYEAHNTEREAQHKNVRVMRADFFVMRLLEYIFMQIVLDRYFKTFVLEQNFFFGF